MTGTARSGRGWGRASTIRTVGVVASLCLLVALAASLVPTSVDSRACGTWVSPSTGEVLDGSYTPLGERDTSEAYEETADLGGCPDALASRRAVAVGLLGGAVVLGVGGVALVRRRSRAGAGDGATPTDD